MIHWCNTETHDHYIVYLYKTSDYSGELIDETEEGKVFWVLPEELKHLPLAPHFNKYLPMFRDDTHSEAFGSWNDEKTSEIVYK